MNIVRNPNTGIITLSLDPTRASDLMNALDFAIDNDRSLGISDVVDLTDLSDLMKEVLSVSYTHLTLPTILLV